MTAIHSRALAAAGVLSLGALLLTGCSSSPATTATAQPSSSGSGAAQFSAYRDCLGKHGVTMPSGRPGGRPSGGSSDRPSGGGNGGGGFGFGGASADPATKAAMAACASLRPTGGFGGAGGRGAGGTATAAFTSCMKDHGVTLPANGGVRALNTADPKTASAYAVCKALLPTRGGQSGSPGATPSPTAS